MIATPIILRRSQADRSAATRRRLLDAAIGLLDETGYAATSTTLVAERAGVSRGAMLHQYAAKADLMAAVLDDVFAAHRAHYAQVLGAIGEPRARFIALPDAAWTVFRMPGAAAQTEIFLAARADRALFNRTHATQARIDHTAEHLFLRLAAGAGLVERTQLRGVYALMLSAIRGLQVRWIATRDESQAHAALAAMKTILVDLCAASQEPRRDQF